MNSQPRILVFTVSSWSSRGGANTYASLLEKYDSALVANLCIRDESPSSSVASRYFAISESKVIKSILKRKIKTGEEKTSTIEADETTVAEHKARYKKYGKKRKYSMLFARELVWKMGKWKTKELDEFLDSFKPDIILHSMEGYIHLNRIIEYAIKRTGAKAIGYIWDDNFTYKQSKSLGYKIYRFFQRKSLKKLSKKTDAFFAITEKTKKEADKFFGIESIVLTKPLSSEPTVDYGLLEKPIKVLYTGNLYIGRDRSLLRLVNCLKELEKPSEHFKIDVYTQTQLSEDMRNALNCDFCEIHEPIPQSEVLKKQKEADILLFLEDVDGKDARVARLSFSTKTTDYLSSGKCIFAIGNLDAAPIEYLKENDTALVATNDNEIKNAIEQIVNNENILVEYATRSANLGLLNHNKKKIEETFYKTIEGVLKMNP